jgi:hypothetical protein
MMNQETIWILGGGKFGSRAARVLRRQLPTAHITVIDLQNAADLPGDVEVIRDDCVNWLVDNLTPDATVDKIVPAVPLHLAVEWLKKILSRTGFSVQDLDIPDSILQRLPKPFRISPSQVALSHADFICPPDCPEPEKICTGTGLPRPQPLFQLLASGDIGDFTPVILRSRQFSRGVGGFYPADLWSLLERCISLPAQPLLVGTACKCHGIVDGISFRAQR